MNIKTAIVTSFPKSKRGDLFGDKNTDLPGPGKYNNKNDKDGSLSYR